MRVGLYKYMCREKGFSVGQYDWDYQARGMDFFSCGGFASMSQMDEGL